MGQVKDPTEKNSQLYFSCIFIQSRIFLVNYSCWLPGMTVETRQIQLANRIKFFHWNEVHIDKLCNMCIWMQSGRDCKDLKYKDLKLKWCRQRIWLWGKAGRQNLTSMLNLIGCYFVFIFVTESPKNVCISASVCRTVVAHDEKSMSLDKNVDWPDVLTCPVTIFDFLRHTHLSLQQATT